MGNSASKAARKLPLRPSPTWAGARTPQADPAAPAAANANRASEQRTAEIEQDATDPDFLANLTKLGPVRVNHGAGIQTTGSLGGQQREPREDPQISKTSRLFQSRLASEEEASSLKPAHNHLYSGSLHALLDERKSAKTPRDLQRLAEKYGVDVDKLENLAKYLNAPSVDKSGGVKTVDKDGNETVSYTALWVQPRIKS
ncbi:hypothetical protein FA15DRAFT_292492 [Coprinopsis marcescibilis]|uniref:Uncharacterized protein n=1 Tax=Coprinopsis marcescibilis TaxID=230819 RepID=A0A5C3L120_COPMA|nr:hypothetical protein FA15DRAFT_292492 [Coprinopsis marcescibilis]